MTRRYVCDFCNLEHVPVGFFEGAPVLRCPHLPEGGAALDGRVFLIDERWPDGEIPSFDPDPKAPA